MIDKVAFVCPLYDMRNHFELAYNLLKSKYENHIDEDIYFVFSNSEQQNKFYVMVKNRNSNFEFKYLMLPDKYATYKSQAVTKKLYGLFALKDSYDFIILVDSESLFIKYCDFNLLANEIWGKKTMLNSNISPDGFFIMRKCFKTMGLYYNKKLYKDLSLYKYNFWFNDLQVYKCEYLSDFFTWLDKLNLDLILDEKCCFEYYIFYAYMLLEHDYKIKKFKYISMGGINEYMPYFSKNVQTQIMKDMDLHWTSSKDAINENVVMLFHLDRDKNDDDYGYQLMKKKNRFFFKRYLIIVKDFWLHM